MSFSMWNQAEYFYNRTLIGGILISLCVVFIGLFVVFYAKRENAVRFVSVLIIGLSITGLWAAGQHQKYAQYLKEYSLINPMIRDRQADAIIPEFYSEREKMVYDRLNDLESLQKLSIYAEKDKHIRVNYLGENLFLHYFEYRGNIFQTSSGITYTADVSDAQIVGSDFTLKDPEYMEIGFSNDLNTMFRTIQVNEKDKNKVYTPESPQDVPSIMEMFPQWNF